MKTSGGLALLLLVFAGFFSSAAPRHPREKRARAWKVKETPHFRIHTKRKTRSLGPLAISLERVHRRAKLDLSSIAAEALSQKVDVFVFPDKRRYLESAFRPPKWSVGLAVYEKNAVAVYLRESRRKMVGTIAHEYAHLVLASFFSANGKEPPIWLNEGLAVLVEDDHAEDPENSPWAQTLGDLKERYFPLETYFASDPGKDTEEARVGLWYTQAYSLARFLIREHSRLQFRAFCRFLRSGASVEDALAKAYRYSGIEDFERAWRRWVREPGGRRSDASRGSHWRMTEFSSTSFKSFGRFRSDFVK